MSFVFVGVGAYAEGNASGVNVTYPWPTGYTPIAGDLSIIFQTGFTDNSTSAYFPNTETGWTKFIQQNWFWTNQTWLCGQASYKVLNGSEGTITINTSSNTSSSNVPGLGYAAGFVAIYRYLDTSLIPVQENPTAINGSTNVKTANTSSTSNSITTTKNDALIVNLIVGNQDGNLSLGTSNGFTLRKANNVGSVGVGCIGFADYEKTTAGAVTMPSWSFSSQVTIHLTFSINVLNQGFCMPGIVNRML